jgi:hypothetical protein
MIFIPPMEIATRIMTLIDNANTELILVSPYISIDNWQKFKKCIQRAIDRGVNITIYARENANQNLQTIISFNVNLYLVKDLHAKIYLNDKYAIASSQNLIQYSDDNSIDFGYSTETEEERAQLLNLIKQYLIVSKPIKKETKKITTPNTKPAAVTNAHPQIIKEFDIKMIYNTFSEKFDNVRMNGDETYLYCTNFFRFGDLMIQEGFEIRFKYMQGDYNPIIENIENLDLSIYNYRYEKKIRMNGLRIGSYMLIPLNVTDNQKLIYDYVFMANKIKDCTKHLVEMKFN